MTVLDLREEGGAGGDGSQVLAVVDTLAGDLDLLTRLEALVRAQGKSGEGRDGQLGVAVGAALDEGSSKGVGLVEVQGNVVGSASGVRQGSRALDPSGVAGLGGQDGAGSGEVVGAGDVGGGAEVGGNTNALQELGGSNEGVDVRDAKVVLALLDGLVAESLGQEGNVLLLLSTDLDEALADPWLETGVLEVFGAQHVERVTVEGGLEVLKGESVVEDDSVDVGLSWSCPLLSWGSCGKGGRSDGDEGCEVGEDHFGCWVLGVCLARKWARVRLGECLEDEGYS